MTRRAIRPLASAAVAMVFSLVGARGEADAPRWLSWTAPAACPSAERVAAEIGAELARRGKNVDGLTVQGRVRAEGERYTLVLGLRHDGVSATRTLEAPSCDALTRTAAFLVALGADGPHARPDDPSAPAHEPRSAKPRATRAVAGTENEGRAEPTLETARPEPAEKTEPEPPAEPTAAAVEPPPEPAPPAQPNPTTPPEPAPTAPPRTPLRVLLAPRALSVDLTAGVWGSGLPGPTGSLALSVGADFGPLRAALGAALGLPREHDTRAGAVRSLALQLALDGCYVRTLGAARPLDLAGCVELGVIHSRVEAPGLTGAGKEAATWLTLGPALRAGVPLFGHFGARLELGLALPMSPRPSFDAAGLGPLLEAGFISGYARLGLGARF